MVDDQAYRRSEKKIKEAQRLGVRTLSLDSINLTELPVSVGELIYLEGLDLSQNQLRSLPESMSQLTQL